MEKMYEIDFELIEDGSIRLEQQSGVEEPNMIWLHPEQLRFIARRMAGMKPDTTDKVADLERKLEVLTDKVGAFVCERSIREEIIEQCANGIEFMVRLDALYDLALEFTGGLATERTMAAGEQAAEKSQQPVRNVSASKADKTQTFELDLVVPE